MRGWASAPSPAQAEGKESKSSFCQKQEIRDEGSEGRAWEDRTDTVTHVGAAGHCPTLGWLPGTRVHIGPALERGTRTPQSFIN